MARVTSVEKIDYRKLSIGPDTYRVADDTDFDVDIFSSSLFVFSDDFETFVVESSANNIAEVKGALTGTMTAMTVKRNGEVLLSLEDANVSLAGLDGRDRTIDGFVLKDYVADLAFMLAGDDDIIGSAFDDRIAGFTGNDAINGEAGDDFLEGWSGNDSLYGDDGDDWLAGGLGNDYLDGGAGYDWADYRDSRAAVTVNLANGQASGGLGSDSLVQIEHVRGSVYNDAITGDDADNTLRGMKGNDTINGGGGRDDFVDYRDASGSVTVDLTTGRSSGADGVDTLSNIENIYGSAYNDSLSGDSNNNFIRGGRGNDVMNGRDGFDVVDYRDAPRGVVVNLSITAAQDTRWGNDTLSGFEGVRGSQFDDVLTGLSASGSTSFLRGGRGDDTLVGTSAGFDYADYRNAEGSVVVNLSTGRSSGADGVDLLTSIEGIRGGSFSDKLVGDIGNNVLRGGRGNDVLDGGAGFDYADYRDASAGVTVNLGTGRTSGEQGVDKLVRIEGIRGSDFGDILIGSASADKLDGRGGADRLSGGTGNDTFVFSALSDTGIDSATRDVISDFVRGQDKIDLSALDANTGTANNDAFSSTLIGSTASFTAAGQLKLASGVLYGNTDADAAAEFSIALTGVTTLSSSDFIL